MKPTIGVIGTGDFATYLIAALRKGGHDGRILLSPYSRKKAEALAERHACEVAADEERMLAESDWIVLAVRPEQLDAALAKLSLLPRHVVISAVAGMTIAQLRATLGEDNPVIRIMPASYIDTVSGGVIPMFPSSADVEAVLTAGGTVVTFDTEQQFELSLVGACLSGWIYRFVGTLEAWFVERGLSQAQARLMVAGNVAGAAGYAMAHPARSLAEISDAIATEGTFTKAGLDHLLDREATLPWRQSLDIVYARLSA